MRKITGILFFALFVFLQYGKLLSFIYCSVRIHIVLNDSISCDCSELLAGDHYKSPLNHPVPSITLKEKLDQPFIPISSPVSKLVPGNIVYYFDRNSICISPGFIHPPQHPPEIMS